MAAKGTESKQKVFLKMLEIYPGAFWEDEGKILRIPMNENGERVEIKVALTAAKTNLGEGAAASAFQAESAIPVSVTPAEIKVTDEEKENVAKLIASLSLDF